MNLKIIQNLDFYIILTTVGKCTEKLTDVYCSFRKEIVTSYMGRGGCITWLLSQKIVLSSKKRERSLVIAELRVNRAMHA